MKELWDSERKCNRRRLLGGAGTAGVSLLAGCASSEGNEDLWGDSDRAETGESASGATVAVVYALGGLDDDAFNDLAQNGAQRAGLDFDIDFTNKEPSSRDEMREIQADVATSTDPEYDLVCCIGFVQADPLRETAAASPDQNFMIVDTAVDEDNVESYLFRQNEGSFQAGNLAGQLTTRDITAGSGQMRPDQRKVGFVGGQDIPPIRQFEAGYTAGVAYADEDVTVLSEFVDGFGDVAGARAAAESMYDDGADIIYHAAGGAGEGVFQAAQSEGRFAIGVDNDQSQSSPEYADVILASMVKRINNAVYQSIRRVVNDEFNGSEVVNLGLDQNGVELVYGAEIGDAVPDAAASAVETSRRRIVSGDISVPSS